MARDVLGFLSLRSSSWRTYSVHNWRSRLRMSRYILSHVSVHGNAAGEPESVFADGEERAAVPPATGRRFRQHPSARICQPRRRSASSSLRYSSAGTSSARRREALMGQTNKRTVCRRPQPVALSCGEPWSERASSSRAAAQPKSAWPIDFCHDFSQSCRRPRLGARDCQCFRHASSSGLQRQRCR